MDIINKYKTTLDMRGYLDILFLRNDTIEICYFDPIKTLKEYYNVKSNDLDSALVACRAAYARLTYSATTKLHYFIPLTSLAAYDIVGNNCIWYYANLYKIFYFEAKVTFLDQTASPILTEIVNGGHQFLNIAIKGVK
jgi:hypothetical protein